MASIEEVWGKGFGQQVPKPISSKTSAAPEKRDAEKEGRVYASPQDRSAAGIHTHRKTIDDLSKSLHIAQTDEDASKNYHGAKYTPMSSSAPTIPTIRESFTPQYAYAPPGFQSEHKLMQLLTKLEESKSLGSDSNSTHDMMLYIFTGIFFLFTLDTFVNLGKRMRRK